MSDSDSGNWNSGDYNSGDFNFGNSNSGDCNSGDWNSGNWNSGNWNSGNFNSGGWNSGDYNSGYWNSGGSNSGYWNSGNFNSGGWNSGDYNSGYWNSTNRESGIFCTIEGTVRCFNKPSDKKWHEIDFPSFDNFRLTEWIPLHEMSDKEKKENPDAETTEGYLKTFEYKDAWKNFWHATTEKNRQKFLDLPNFDADIFEEITGIDVTSSTQNIANNYEIAKCQSLINEIRKEIKKGNNELLEELKNLIKT